MAPHRVGLSALKKSMRLASCKKTAEKHKRFFKTGPGDYAEGEIFLGISMPNLRALSKEFESKVTLKDACVLLRSEFHEERMMALLLMIQKFQFKNQCDRVKLEVFDQYVNHFNYINNNLKFWKNGHRQTISGLEGFQSSPPCT